MEGKMTYREELLEKVAVLKKNTDTIPFEELVNGKYAKAYARLKQDILSLLNSVISSEVAIFDLAIIKKEAIPEMTQIIKECIADCIKEIFVEYSCEKLSATIETVAGRYADAWSKNVIGTHKEGDRMVFNPMTMSA